MNRARFRWTEWLHWVVVLFVAGAGAAPATEPGVEQYRVNAQFRGGIKKSFEDLGTVRVSSGLRRGQRHVELRGRIRDPDEDGVVYEFLADVGFGLNGRAVTSRAKSRFSADAAEYEARILEMAPFLWIVRDAPRPMRDETIDYSVNGKPYHLRYSETDRNVEITLYEGLRTVGKFFLSRGPRREIEKFRLNTARKTVLSFGRELGR